ncbi:lysin A [Mycobacterium phage LittleGuy]|uniref:Lysin A n=1 Tax=Mycobacterium phage Nyxis TaxID=1445714 RepID=W0LN01_9CAUD|nr:endolysin [Mycobacterium phage Nyxis]AHG24053.1 lysin A [Mycobacterium phage Nyxis]AOT27428.1 lysin A [Mycobacterium phage LittleGuy]
MARRLFRGRAFSENGWPYVDQGSCTWVEVVPGVWLQFQNGPCLTVMVAFARDFHAHVEPLRDYDSACWTQDNTVDTSNHPGGTGMDLNWNGADQKTFRYGITKERAYPGDKARKLDELLAFYEDVIYCGGYWSIRDWMHFQMGYGTYDSKADRPTEKTLDFIRRKIRPDGFSTFNRGGSAAPDAASILARATGIPLDRARTVLPTLRDGLIQAECNTFPRIAMFLAQTCWESDQYRATEEYANGPMNEERWIYKGRTWIQLTWRSAYEGFGRWCHARGLVDDPMVFVNNPRSLADLRWAGLGAAYYWTTTVRNTRKYPTLNQASDARDVLVATQIVNGGTTHLAERTAIYNRAIALGDELLHILGEEEDFLSALNPQEQRLLFDKTLQVWGALFNKVESKSGYRNPGGTSDPANMWAVKDYVSNMDGFIHEDFVESQAKRGNMTELARVVQAARGRGADTSPGFVARAQRVLAEIERDDPEILQRFLAAERGAA